MKPNQQVTKRGNQSKQFRWEECAKYIRRARDMDHAKELAALDHKHFNTSVWVTAFGKILGGKL